MDKQLTSLITIPSICFVVPSHAITFFFKMNFSPSIFSLIWARPIPSPLSNDSYQPVVRVKANTCFLRGKL